MKLKATSTQLKAKILYELSSYSNDCYTSVFSLFLIFASIHIILSPFDKLSEAPIIYQ